MEKIILQVSRACTNCGPKMKYPDTDVCWTSENELFSFPKGFEYSITYKINENWAYSAPKWL